MSALNATVFALQYGLPLYAYAKLAAPFVALGAVNYFIHSTRLSTPSQTTVVLPNVDTIYSAAVYDISQNDVVVTIPAVDAGRYWSFAFYDPFGNNFATPGSVHNTTPGNYLLRHVSESEWGIQPIVSTNTSSKYQGYINSPTIDGTVLARVLVKNNGTDLTHVQALVNASNLTPIPRNNTGPASLTKANLQPYSSTNNTALATLQLLGTLSDANPPFNVSAKEVGDVYTNLFNAGVYVGGYHPPPNVNLTEAYELAVALLQDYLTKAYLPYNNGWYHLPLQGLFGDKYLVRTLTAQGGYLELGADQVLYPTRASQQFQFSNNESYIFTFSGKPPIADDGFWSLTLYNSEGYLVPNSLNKYEVGDRSNITYANETPVYGGISSTTEDGQFQVLIQAANIPPPANWTNNWLPGPIDGSNASITLRFYAPTSAFTDGTYIYPSVARIQPLLA